MRKFWNAIWEAIKFIGLAIGTVIGVILCFIIILVGGGMVLGLIGLLSPLIIITIFVIGIIACFFIVCDWISD